MKRDHPTRGWNRRSAAIFSALLLCGLSFVSPPDLRGQEPGASEAAQQTDPSAGEGLVPPGAISPDRIPRRLEQDLERLRQIQTSTLRDEGYDQAQSELIELLGSVNAILDNFEGVSIGQLNAAGMASYRAGLNREARRLDVRAERLQRRFEQIESDQQALDRMRLEWALTRDSLGIDTLTAPTFDIGIVRIIAAADSAQSGLDSLVLDLLDQGEELASTSARIEAALSRLEDVESAHRRQLLVRGYPPLWNPVRVLAEERLFFGQLGQSTFQEIAVFRESLRADRGKLLLHLLLYLITLAVLLRLRRASEEWPEDESLTATRFFLSRPYSAALLSALLATNWIYPYASFLIYDLVLLLTLLPVVRLLPPLVLEDRRKSVFAILALFFASRIATLLPLGTLLDRLVLLGLAIGFALWAGSQDQKMATGEGNVIRGRLMRPYQFAVRIGLVLAIASAVCNVAGWVNLAEVIIQGLIPTAYTAILLALGSMILIGIVRGFALGPILNRSQAFSENRDRVVRVATFIIRAAAVLVWFRAMFAWFGLDREVGSLARDILTHEFTIGAVEITIGSILLFILVLWLATWLGRIVRTLLRDDVLSRMSISPGQADAWATLAQWAILVGGILFAAASAGIAGGQLAVLAGALGVGIGFGLQNIVNNFVSGFILIFEQPIKVGDKIEISSLGLLGEVRRIGVRSSTIRTFDGSDVVVPNSNLIQSEVVNWTLSDSKRRFQVEVGVKYGTDPQRVIDLLLEVAAEHPRVLKYPTPTALFLGFGDSSLNFRLNIWSATFEDFFGLRSEVNVLVNDRLKTEGIEIPFPQRDLHLRSVAPEVRGVARKTDGHGLGDGSGTAPDGDDDGTSDD